MAFRQRHLDPYGRKLKPEDIRDIRIYRCDDWAALYINGELDTGPGDAYLCDERLYEILGIEVIDDDAYLRGGGKADDVCLTVEAIEEYQRERQEKLDEAARLKDQVAEMQQRIRELEGKKVS